MICKIESKNAKVLISYADIPLRDDFYRLQFMLISEHQALQQKGQYHHLNGSVFGDVSFGFLPAFKNLLDDQVHLSVDCQGTLAVMHLLDRLPAQWVAERDEQGRAVSLISSVVAGFVRNDQFYTLAELMGKLRDS